MIMELERAGIYLHIYEKWGKRTMRRRTKMSSLTMGERGIFLIFRKNFVTGVCWVIFLWEIVMYYILNHPFSIDAMPT